MGADQPGHYDWTFLTMREDGFSMERVEGITAAIEKWDALKLDRNVRAVYLYDPNGRYHDSRVRPQ